VQQADLKVSVHLITTVLTKADGDIDDEMLERHSGIDCEIYDLLQGFGDCNLFDNLECTAYSNRPEHGAIHTVMLFTSEAAQLRNDTGSYAEIEFPSLDIEKVSVNHP